MERRLAAIVAADAVGFSALAERDEAAALRLLKAHVAALEPLVAFHDGRIFKRTGDGFLAAFGSVVDAVSCADAMQKRLAERNADAGEGALGFRMGVHVGDVVVDDDDLLGDGVNIAARLEKLAPPGGIAVSGRVREDVAGKLDLDFTDLGRQDLKNISRPVHVFTVGARLDERPVRAMVLPEKPSVAVLPFTNMSAAADDDYFADGVTEDIITALAYVPWIFVIARNSSFAYKGLSVDIRRIGRDLGVRYVLEGSVRRSGQRLRVTGQLIDAETGNHIWAERYDGELEDIFDLQDRISEAVVNAIAPEIQSAEIRRVMRKSPDSLDAYDMYLRGQNAMHGARLDEARDWLKRSLEVAPGFAKARAVRAWTGTAGLWYGYKAVIRLRDECLADARAALEQEPNDPEVAAFAGYTIGFYEANPHRGVEFLEAAARRCPSFAWAWASASMMCAFAGLSAKAVDYGATALRLNPRDPLAFRVHLALALAHLTDGAMDAALEAARSGLALNPRAVNIHRLEIIALHALGHRDDAARELRRYLEVSPDFCTSDYLDVVTTVIGMDGVVAARIGEGLRAAGFPE